MIYDPYIMRYIPRKLNVNFKSKNSSFCNEKIDVDTLGRKERDKFAVNSSTLDEICKFCNS